MHGTKGAKAKLNLKHYTGKLTTTQWYIHGPKFTGGRAVASTMETTGLACSNLGTPLQTPQKFSYPPFSHLRF